MAATPSAFSMSSFVKRERPPVASPALGAMLGGCARGIGEEKNVIIGLVIY